jgi:transcription factor E2F7/8
MMFGPPKISRKQKSLGLLCEKFIKRFPEAVPDGVKCEIPLDDLAKSMSTERRRIYDIVNVLEAVQMMTKVGYLEFFSH